MDENIYKIAIAAFLHDIGKFAERANMSVGKEFLLNNADLYQPFYDNRYTHRHAVYTAAFIDHIEKLLPREFNRRDWGLEDPFINLAAGHHKPQTPLQWIIALADRVSSGFERNEFESYNQEVGVKDYKKTRLLPIFEEIAIDGVWKEDSLDSRMYRYPLEEISPHNIFPCGSDEYRSLESEEASKEYSDLFFNFIASLEKLSHRQNIPLWFEHFDSLFMIYASHIPAATVGKVVPDVSLYDHSKTTASLASAIYLYHLQNNSIEVDKIMDYDDKKFLIVTGDLYGIQNFIFSEGGSTNKASAKLLRGRSFAVSLLSELAADMLCREIGLPMSSMILNAAGKFTLFAPNTNKTRNWIRSVEERINDWLVKMFYGETALGISYVEASCSDFVSQQISHLSDELSRVSDEKKYHKIGLEKHGGAVEDYLDNFNNDLKNKLCPFCGKRPSNSEVEHDPLLGDEKSACKVCRDHIFMGTNLVKASRIAITASDAKIYGDKLKEPIFGYYQLSFDVTGKMIELSDKGTLLKYWDVSPVREGPITKDITSRFINGYIPFYTQEDESDDVIDRLLHGSKTEKRKNELFDMIRKGDPKTFHHIAKMALNQDADDTEEYRGIEALGVLKADVDNLGLIFSCGLKHNSLSRITTLSRQMNHYFTLYLPCILSTEKKFRDIYTVFAGGDDLFLIGPWNRIIELSVLLHSSFKNYVCGNPQITISAGISINKPGEPVSSIAERAEDALNKSKQNGKDSTTLFDESVKWSDFKNLDEIKKTINAWMDAKVINNAMLFRLNSFSHMAKQEKELLKGKEGIDMEEWECLKWRAMFKYNLARNVGKGLKGDEKQKAIKEVEKAASWLAEYGGAMKIPIWQIIYNKR